MDPSIDGTHQMFPLVWIHDHISDTPINYPTIPLFQLDSQTTIMLWHWGHSSQFDIGFTIQWTIDLESVEILKCIEKGMRYVVDMNTWNALADYMVLEERWIYGLNVPCLACLYSCRLSASGWLIECCVWSHRLPNPLGLLGS